MFFNLFNEVGGKCFKFRVDFLRGDEGKVSSNTRLERMTNHFQRVVDRSRVNGRRVESLLLPALENHRHAMIPKGEMTKQRADGPAVIGGEGEVCVGESAHKGVQSAARLGVLLRIRE